MSFQVGDKVVRVKTCDKPPCSCRVTGAKGPRVGEVCTITAILPNCRCEAGMAIKLAGYTNRSERIGWCRGDYRKVADDKREACEPEFVTLLKRSKRKVEA